ncbi:MAG: glycosyltransferase [candidate division KSB1 bacterium]|nr:glycosyltransferase [candidate division KSB1 bacterium]
MNLQQEIHLAEKLFEQGDIASARKRLEALQRRHPSNAEVLNNLAVIAQAEGDTNTALQLLWKAWQHDAGHADVQNNLLTVLIGQEKWAAMVALCGFYLRLQSKLAKRPQTWQDALETVVRQWILHYLEHPEAGFWHDHKEMPVALKKTLAQNEIGPKNPKAFWQTLAAAMTAVALHAQTGKARRWLLKNPPGEAHKPLWQAVLAVLWLLDFRVYEAIHFAEPLLAKPETRDLGQAMMDRARQMEPRPEVDQAYRRLLVVMEEGIGNMVMMTPTLRALRQRFPESHIAVMGKKPSTDILTDLNCVDEVLHGWQDERFDLALCGVWSSQMRQRFQRKFDENVEFVYAADLRVGLEHEAEANFKLARFLGYRGEMPMPSVTVRKPDLNVKLKKPVAVLANASQGNGGWERKRWPHYRELAKRLMQKGYTVVAVGGIEEAERFGADYWPAGVIDLQGRLSLPETAWVLQKADLFIGNDSAPAHLAAAVGTSTFVLFGATLITKNRPLGKNVRVLTRDLACSPCQYTERWQTCQDWQCMIAMSPEWVLQEVERGIETPRLMLVRKDYRDLRLIRREDGLILSDGQHEERLVVHLVGKGKTNFPWGMEIEVQRVLEQMGCEVFHTDYVADRHDFKYKFLRPAHLMLVFRGSGIPPELIQQASCRTVLWYQDDVFSTRHAPRDLAYNGRFFDAVYTFDYNAIDAYREFGIQKVDWLPLAAAPEIYHKQFLEKKYDVVFVGNLYPNRKTLVERLSKKFDVKVFQAYNEEAAQIYNQSKIVLNLGIGRTGIQQRVFEVLLCGAFLMTNEIPKEGRLFEDRKHLVYFNENNIEELIAYYLEHEDERERIAENGYRLAMQKHTYRNRLEKLLRDQFVFEEESGTRWNERRPTIQVREAIPGFRPVNVERIRQRLQSRELRIFAAFRNFNWENPNLQPALESFGAVIRYDWHEHGFSQYDPGWHESRKARMNQQLLEAVSQAHQQASIDIFFGYLSGRLIFPGMLQAIRRMGILSLNIYLDDVKGFWGNLEPTGFSSMIDIANGFDLCWTTHEPAVAWYEAMGGRAIFLPPGANPEIFRPIEGIEKDIDVVFVGQKYGRRGEMIERLRALGIDARGFGRGWDTGEVSQETMIELFSRARIVLGMAETPEDHVTELQIKGRDFEVPMCGALYLTQHNPALQPFFRFGEEIDTYRDQHELISKVRYYLSHPEHAEQIRRKARRRSLRDHTWEARFQTAFEALLNAVSE